MRSGSWVTGARLRVYPLIVLAASLLGVLGLVLSSDGRVDPMHRPLGTDFSQVWVAGTEVLGGHPAAPFDPVPHAAAQRAAFGPEAPFYGWHYPPYFLGLAAVLALMPYALALVVWQAATLPLYVGGVRAALGGARLPRAGVLGAALGFPAVYVNLTHGHNGFLTAGLLAFGLAARRDRPLLRACCSGCWPTSRSSPPCCPWRCWRGGTGAPSWRAPRPWRP